MPLTRAHWLCLPASSSVSVVSLCLSLIARCQVSCRVTCPATAVNWCLQLTWLIVVIGIWWTSEWVLRCFYRGAKHILTSVNCRRSVEWSSSVERGCQGILSVDIVLIMFVIWNFHPSTQWLVKYYASSHTAAPSCLPATVELMHAGLAVLWIVSAEWNN